ncbi:unnamed protein product [Oikopleura dioica]|uniref:Sushi domain-containing protein n=1 Tax=Oikopleura dioica TaxID=34765 RepID=E4Y754_OIKDI|nr:unnamed protein product [Oikopleura dioica]
MILSNIKKKVVFFIFAIFLKTAEGQNITARNGFVNCIVPEAADNNLENIQCADNEQYEQFGDIKEGTKCTFDCKAGSTLVGEVSELICRDDGNVEFVGFCKCDGCCDAPPYKSDLSINCSNGYKKKSTCEVSCLTGELEPIDSPTTITCQKKSQLWSAPWPDCISGETTTEIVTTTESQPVETTTQEQTTTTSYVSTSMITTTTSEVQTTLVDNEDNSIVGLKIETLSSTSIRITWNDQSDVKNITITATDPFGNDVQINDIDPTWTGYIWTGATPGFKYLVSMKVVLSDDTELNVKANASLTHPKNEDLYKCIVCNSKVGNTACNDERQHCDITKGQMCQTVVRAENGLPARFEKRCKQKLACENQRAMFKAMGLCGGGSRRSLVDVCVYCCEGNFCNAEGAFSNTV